MKKLETLGFKHFCMSVGNLPSSYVESLSYYECLLWLIKYLQEEVIPTVNNNSEAVTELQNLFIELQNYVNTYFDNLDVQEEINNKLDEMTESGELEQIIQQYIIQDYIKVDSLTLADKYLYLFGADKDKWIMTGQRVDEMSYSAGECIVDYNTNNVYKCTTSGISGSSYPTFGADTVSDGTVIWSKLEPAVSWNIDTDYSVDDTVKIKDLTYVCKEAHKSLKEDGYNIKIKNGFLYKRVDNNKLSNYPEMLLTFGYDTVNKTKYEGMEVPNCAMEVSNDGINFNVVDTPMLLNGQDFSPLFRNGKYYILTFTKQRYNDFGLYITDNFKDNIKTEINLNISDSTHPHVWFAQWFEDTKENKLYILYSASDEENPTVTYNGNEYPNLRLWKVEVTDLDNLTFGTPSEINLSDNNRFDVFIQEKGGSYYLFTRRYIDNNDNSHEGHVEIWLSNDLENWSLQTSRISALNNSGYEAMSVTELNGKYYMYVSKNLNYDFNRVWRIESEDLINWSNLIPIKPTTVNLNELGTVVKIKNQEALSYLSNYITTNDNSRNLLKPTNYLKLESAKSVVWRNLNFDTHTFNVLSAEDIMYYTGLDTNILISTITSNHEIPHRFFIRTVSTGDGYIRINNSGNIYLPDGYSEIYVKRDIILEFVYNSDLQKYVIVSPSKEYFHTSNARVINLNGLATNNVISNLELEDGCLYTVTINTKLTINAFTFKNNYQGKFHVYFMLAGNGSTHTTQLTLKSGSSALITQYGTSADLVLTSTNNSNKMIPFGREFGTGSLYLQSF